MKYSLENSLRFSGATTYSSHMFMRPAIAAKFELVKSVSIEAVLHFCMLGRKNLA